MAVEEPAKNKGGSRIGEHSQRIEQRQDGSREEMLTREVHDDERIVGKAKGKEADAKDIHHKALADTKGNILLRLRLKVLWMREALIHQP